MNEHKIADMAARFMEETGKEPTVLFLNCKDWVALGQALYPHGPKQFRTALQTYAGLRIQVMNGDQSMFVGPEPKILTELRSEHNYQLDSVTRCLARGVKFLPPDFPNGPVHRCVLSFSVTELFDGERAAGWVVNPINIFDCFYRVIAGQQAVLPHDNPFTRLVYWVQENDLSLMGDEESDTLTLYYPKIHSAEQAPLLLKAHPSPS
jgi:hypothetical protein